MNKSYIIGEKETGEKVISGKIVGGRLALAIVSGIVFPNAMLPGIGLFSNTVNATSSSTNNSVVDEINLKVPISCTLTGAGMDTHNAEIHNGQINSAIGETTLKAYCNDIAGFAIYAVGYTDNIDGKNVLTNSSLDSTSDIATGTATGPVGNVDTSNWAMKLSTVSSPVPTYPIVIQNNYSSFHRVPEYYELVAKRESATDVGTNAEGSTLKTTYQAYISSTQLAGTYTGQVKYTLVHPSTNYAAVYDITYNANTEDTVTDLPAEQLGESTNGVATLSSTKPVREGYGFYGWCTTVPAGPNCSGTTYRAGKDYPIAENSTNQVTLYAIWATYSELDSGTNVNAKMKSLAAGTSMAYNDDSDDIKAIRMANSLPSGFVPSDANTISTSEVPTYIYFDNTNDAGIMYVYTTADKVRTNANSASLFASHTALTDISGVADWDIQNTTYMVGIFADVGLNNVSALANWDVSNVTALSRAFNGATNLSDISGLANWDTSSVISIGYLFKDNSSLTSVSALANWDVSNVTSMTATFNGATSLTNLSGLENWDTSSLSAVTQLFDRATSLSDISALANWDASHITSTGLMFRNATSLTNVSALAKWDTSSLRSTTDMFQDATNLSDVSGLADWNFSNATSIKGMFWNTPNLVDLSPLSEWDVSNVSNMNSFLGLYNMTKTGNAIVDLTPLSKWEVGNVTRMYTMFQNMNIPSFKPLANWDVSSVEDFSYMFNYGSVVVDSLDGLEDWNVSSAKNMSFMFGHLSSLRDVSAINDWDITGVTATAGDATEENNLFYRMFTWSPVYPEFSKRVGTWNSLGTFIPSE